MAKKEKERKRKNPKVGLYTLISLFLFFLPLKKCGVYQKNEQKSREYGPWIGLPCPTGSFLREKNYSRAKMLPHVYNNSINHSDLQHKLNH